MKKKHFKLEFIAVCLQTKEYLKDPSKFAAAVAAPAASAGAEKVEAKKEESESEDEDMGFGLFD